LFTHYLIDGLSGAADVTRIMTGNGDGKVDIIELEKLGEKESQLTQNKI